MSERARAAASIVCVALVLSACPSSSNPRPSATPTSSPTSSPRGGEMTIAYPSEPPTLDPFAPGGDSTPTRDILQLLMPSLFGPDRFTYELASTAPVIVPTDPVRAQGSGSTYRINLRPGAAWSDGRPITVRDFRATWQRARNAEQPRTRALYRRIARITGAPGSVTVRFDRVMTDVDWLFSEGLGVLPAHAIGAPQQRRRLASAFPVSGGPFVLKRWRKGLDMTFERNPNAFAPLAPALDGIRIVFVPDALGALALFERGAVDALGPYSTADFARRAADVSGAQVSSEVQSTIMRLVLSMARAPLRQDEVREALIRSFDRARAVGGLLGPEGQPAPCAPCGVTSLTQAKALLQGAGWTGRPIRRRAGRRLALTVAVENTDELGGFLARALQRGAAVAGFDVQVVALDAQTFWTEWLRGDDLQAAIVTRRVPILGRGQVAYDLARMNVSLAGEAGLTLSSDAGGDGPFAAAATWHR